MSGGGGDASSRVADALRGPSDTALAAAARSFINSKLRGIGEVTDLVVDTAGRSFHGWINLAGEAEPIDVHVTGYELQRRDDGTALVIREAFSNRRWVDVALAEHVVGRRLPIPAAASAVLALLA